MLAFLLSETAEKNCLVKYECDCLELGIGC